MFSIPDQSFFKQDFHLPISFFPFPSPFDDESFELPRQPGAAAAVLATTKTAISEQKVGRKRTSKKDRHSKISTARGLRDRRMRLSLPVARQFFGLQDMLGVDKASKTVEWLLIQARPEIMKLAKERNYSLQRAKSVCSSNSECDMVSGIDEVGVGNENSQKEGKKLRCKEKTRARQPRKALGKESRDMARARARARVREKMQVRDSVLFDRDANDFASSWSSPFETGVEVEKPMNAQFETSEGIIAYQNSFEIMEKWSPSPSTFNYLQQTETLLEVQHQFPNSKFFG